MRVFVILLPPCRLNSIQTMEWKEKFYHLEFSDAHNWFGYFFPFVDSMNTYTINKMSGNQLKIMQNNIYFLNTKIVRSPNTWKGRCIIGLYDKESDWLHLFLHCWSRDMIAKPIIGVRDKFERTFSFFVSLIQISSNINWLHKCYKWCKTHSI